MRQNSGSIGTTLCSQAGITLNLFNKRALKLITRFRGVLCNENRLIGYGSILSRYYHVSSFLVVSEIQNLSLMNNPNLSFLNSRNNCSKPILFFVCSFSSPVK